MKRILLAVMATLAIFSACTSNKKVEETKEKLRIGVMPSVDHLALAVAVDQHYYDSLGLDLELVRFMSPMERDAALQAGEIDGTVSDYTTVMLQNQKGLPVKLLTVTDGIFAFMVSPTADIKTVADLKGKKVGLSSNTVIEYATDKLLVEAGLTPNDVQKVEVQKVPLRLEMLAKGELDAAVLPQPFVQLGLVKGLKQIPGVLGIGSDQIHITGLALHTENVKGKEKAIESLLKGYNRAIDYLNSTEISKWSPIVARELKLDETVVSQMSFGLFTPATSPAASDIDAVAKWLQGKALVPATYTGNEAVMPLPQF